MWRGTQGPQNVKVSKKIVYNHYCTSIILCITFQGGKWNNVTDHKLSKLVNVNVSVVVRYVCLTHSTAEEDTYDVYEEVITMAGSWEQMAAGLRLPPPKKSLIATKHSNNPEKCLLAVVEEWLKGVCNVQKYGHPSWRLLVQAVADPIGGANPALAHSIAAKHLGNHHLQATEPLVLSHMLVSLMISPVRHTGTV